MTQIKTAKEEDNEITAKIFIAEDKVNDALEILNECYKREKHDLLEQHEITYSRALNSIKNTSDLIYNLRTPNRTRTIK